MLSALRPISPLVVHRVFSNLWLCSPVPWVSLHESIKYANVAISLINDDDEIFINGYVPVVVAKCGVFLKEKATNVEGIFWLSDFLRRIKYLLTLPNAIVGMENI